MITKHFQAYIQTTPEKKFLCIWEKLGEIENQSKRPEGGPTSNQSMQRQYQQNSFHQQRFQITPPTTRPTTIRKKTGRRELWWRTAHSFKNPAV